MTGESAAPTFLEEWYTDRIGSASTGDEVAGYWLFVLGVIFGFLGIVMILPSRPASSMRKWAIVFAALGLALLIAGPLIRLPLRKLATTLVYVGVLVCALAIVWFITVYPPFRPQASPIITVYSLGILAMVLGGVIVPLATTRTEAESAALADEVEQLRQAMVESEADEADLARVISDLEDALRNAEADEADLARAVAALEGERDEAASELADLEADEADLAMAIRDLQETLADTEADEADLAFLVEQLQHDLADAHADEDDLATQLRVLHSSQARFELFEDSQGQHRWRLRHRNGNVIADCGEGYTRRHNAQKGLQSVRRNALGASVFQIESEDELPEEGESFEPVAERESRASFELYEDKRGKHRFRLRHDNGNILADSGQGYGSKQGLRGALDRLKAYIGPADYLRFDPTAIEIYRDRANEWRWRLIHRNGNILADSGESYTRRRDTRRAVNRLKERIGEMESEVYEDNAGEYRWRLQSSNNQIMADSGEGYSDRSSAQEALENVMEYIPETDALDIGWAAFEIFEDKAGEFRWRLRHRNGNILADSGEGYSDRSGAIESIESVKRNGPNAPEAE